MEPPPELVAVGAAAAPGAGAFMPVLEVLRELSFAAPVVLALEDVHWADRSTLDLLTFLARRLREERLLVVVTYRSDEIDRRPALRGFVAEAARRAARPAPRAGAPDARRGAGPAGRASSRARPARPFAEAIFARSEGNPLFAEELVSAAERTTPSGCPTALRDMLLARDPRPERLAAQDVVRAAAVGGRRVHHELLAGAAGLDRGAADRGDPRGACASTSSSPTATA